LTVMTRIYTIVMLANASIIYMDVVYAGNAGAIDSMDGVGRATQEAKADIQCQSI